MHARKRGRLRAVLALMVIVALIAAIPLTVAAQQSPHVIFTGKGFIDNHLVADGTVVEAWIRGVPVAATKTFNSEYQLYIAEPHGESFQGAVIRFKLGGYGTDVATGWKDGREDWILLYAYTGRQGYPDGFDGDVTAEPEPLDMNAIRELQARLLDLERERTKSAAELDRQMEIDIADVTNRWEGAISELRAEVEREIQRVKREFELKQRRISLGPRREALLNELDAELDAFIRDKWAEFELESKLMQGYLYDDIFEIGEVRGQALHDLGILILNVKDEIKKRLGKVGILYDDFPIPDDLKNPFDIFRVPENPKTPVISVAPHPVPTPDPVVDLFTPGTPTPETPAPGTPVPKEPGRNRGFFTNSISANPNGLNNGLDPTALAVIGILITLAATGVQLVKGN